MAGIDLAAFKAYCADPKRSIRPLSRRLHKSVTLLGVWSRKHHWQQRLRELETQAALAENERAAQADAEAKKETALLMASSKWQMMMPPDVIGDSCTCLRSGLAKTVASSF